MSPPSVVTSEPVSNLFAMGFFSDSDTEEEDPAAEPIPVPDAAALDEAGVAAAEQGGEAVAEEEQIGREKFAEEEDEEEESCTLCGGQSSVRESVVDGELKCIACARIEQPQDENDDADGEGPPRRRRSNEKRLDTDGCGYTRGEFIEYYGEQVPLPTLSLSPHLVPSLHPSPNP